VYVKNNEIKIREKLQQEKSYLQMHNATSILYILFAIVLKNYQNEKLILSKLRIMCINYIFV